jgi:hypothetical protein
VEQPGGAILSAVGDPEAVDAGVAVVDREEEFSKRGAGFVDLARRGDDVPGSVGRAVGLPEGRAAVGVRGREEQDAVDVGEELRVGGVEAGGEVADDSRAIGGAVRLPKLAAEVRCSGEIERVADRDAWLGIRAVQLGVEVVEDGRGG